jgi:hypothetical protein
MENLCDLIVHCPEAFETKADGSLNYKGPVLPYANRSDLRSGKVSLMRGHNVKIAENARRHSYEKRVQAVGEAWFI